MRPVRFTLFALVVVCAVNFLTAAPASAALENVLVFSETAGFRARLDPGGHRRDPGARRGQRLRGRRHRGLDAVQRHQPRAVPGRHLPLDHRRRPQRHPAGRVRALHPRRRRLRRDPRGGRHRVHWAWYGELVGAYFRPSARHADATVDVEDPTHPSTDAVPARWTRTDEWYNYKPPAAGPNGGGTTTARAATSTCWPRVDETTYDEAGRQRRGDDDHPIAWCSDFDGGRSLYTGIGHTTSPIADAGLPRAPARRHPPVDRAAGADCGPSACPRRARRTSRRSRSTTTPEPVRARHRARRARLLHRAQRPGEDLEARPPSTTVEIGTMPGHTSQENGLLGFQLAPDFATTGHIYLTYSALPDGSNQNRCRASRSSATRSSPAPS